MGQSVFAGANGSVLHIVGRISFGDLTKYPADVGNCWQYRRTELPTACLLSASNRHRDIFEGRLQVSRRMLGSRVFDIFPVIGFCLIFTLQRN